MGKTCSAPESVPGLPDRILNQMAEPIQVIAENRIFDQYARRRGTGAPSTIFPNRGGDGTQIFRDFESVAGGPLNTAEFIKFLKANNSQVDEVNLALQMSMAGGGIKNPDWITHRASKAEFEFYEVKPNSAKGKEKGRGKILFLIALFGSQRPPLQYIPGLLYFPQDEEEVLWVETKGFMETEITLRWFRLEPGLIVYEVCIDSKLREPAPQKAKNAVDAAAMLLMMLILSALEAGPALAM